MWNSVVRNITRQFLVLTTIPSTCMCSRKISSSFSLRRWNGDRSGSKARQRNRNSNRTETDEENDSRDFSSKEPSGGALKMARQKVPDTRNIAPSMRNKFRLFQDETEEVLDSARAEWTVVEAPIEVDDMDEFEGLNLERGRTGVMDIEDLVEVLRLENAVDLCVVTIPPEVKFVDYMVVACGRSSRQLLGMAQFISRYYKAKKNKKDPHLNQSVAKFNDSWICLDLGNIILHLMDESTRVKYDIEALWALGPEHDKHHQDNVSEAVAMVEKHTRIVT